jgi:hypothetical protein
MVSKRNAFVIAAVLAALASPGIAVPAFAKDNGPAPGWDACFALAVERGSGPHHGGGSKEMSQHKAFMNQCLEGKIPLSGGATASATVRAR